MHLPRGAAYERLFDLTNLGGTNQLSEMTETGGTFTDECNGLGPIGYWSYYYELNATGYRNFSPRKAMFGGRYFYKINTEPVPKGALEKRLHEIYDPRPDKVIFVKGDTTVTYQEVLSAMDVARGSGVKVIGIPPKDVKKAG